MGTVHAKAPNGNGSISNMDMAPPIDRDDDRRAEATTVDLNGVSARVDRVHIDGIDRTKDAFVKPFMADLFTASNFEEMIKSAHKVRSKLIDLGIFRNIAIHIDTSNGPNASPDGYEVTFLVQELKRITGGVTTHVATSNNEGMLTVAMSMPNMLGAGEQLKGEYTYGSKRSRNFNLTFLKPIYKDKWNIRPSLSILENDSEWPMSGYKITERGCVADLLFFTKPSVKNSISWEGMWRSMGVGNKFASFDVRKDSGHTFKSSLKHVATSDTRDSPIFPTGGSLIKLATELAGIGGDVAYLKNEFNFQINRPIITSDFVIQGSFNAGVLNSLNEQEPFVYDKFFLGGPISLRGFDFRGIGPKRDNDFIGGNYYWSAALHLYSPLPFRPGSGGFGELFRTHLFVNAGNIGSLHIDNIEKWLDEQKEFRLACGVGIALRLGQMARIELNYCIPFYFQENKDNSINGFQFGVGVNFV